jgi:hypothetical protein
VQDPPHGGVRDGGHDAPLDDGPTDVRHVQAGHRQLELGGQLTGNGLDLKHDAGGKDPRPAAAGALLQALQAFLEEALAPLGHDLPGQVQPGADVLVRQPLGREQDDLGPQDLSIR